MERERGGGGLREGVMVSLQLVEWPFWPIDGEEDGGEEAWKKLLLMIQIV